MASGYLKQIISVIMAMAKAKTLALKSKTRAIKTRLVIFSLLRNKKNLMSSIPDKLRTLMGQQYHQHHKKEVDDKSRAFAVVHNSMSQECLPNPTNTDFADDDFENQEQGCDDDGEEDKYPDLTHSPFEQDPGGSVIDLVKNSKPEGEEFRLEDEIDQIVDLFIKRFHLQIRIQKQLSFKRYQEMLQGSA